MELIFRIDCPKCNWGHEVKNSYINRGFVKGKCAHCGNPFFFKLKVMGVNLQVEQE